MRLDPIDVDQIYPGQGVVLMFWAFNRRTTPDVAAQVARISGGPQLDGVTGLS